MVSLRVMLFPLLRKYKKFFISMILATSISIALWVGLVGVEQNLKKQINNHIETYKYADVFAQTNVTNTNIDGLLDIEGVVAVDKRIVLDCKMDYKGENLTPRVYTYTKQDYASFCIFETLDTAYPSIYVDKRFAERNNMKLGDELNLSYRFYSIHVQIGGIVSRPEGMNQKESRYMWGETNQFGYIYVEVEQIQNLFPKGAYNQIEIYTDGTVDTLNVKNDVLEYLSSLVTIYDIYTYSASLVNTSIELQFGILSTLDSILPPVFFLVTLLVIFIFMLQIVESERRNAGIFKALGFENRHILAIYLAISFLLAVISIGIGILLSIPISTSGLSIYLHGYSIPYHFPKISFTTLFYASLATILTYVLGNLLCFYFVLRVNPKEAMSTQGVENRGNRKLKGIHLPVKAKLGFTLISRNLKRYIFTILCAASTVMMVFTSIFFFDVEEKMKQQTYEVRFQYDCCILYNKPVSDYILDIYNQEDFITKTERMGVGFLDGTSKEAKVELVVYGLTDTDMLHVVDETGEKETTVLPTNGIILSSEIAEKMKVSVGDTIQIDDVSIEVEGISKQYIAPVCYMSFQKMKEMNWIHLGGVFVNTTNKEKLTTLASETYDFMTCQYTEDLIRSCNYNFNKTMVVMAYILVFALVIAVLIISSATKLTIHESKREIVTLKTIGIYQQEIEQVFGFLAVSEFVFSMGIGIPIGLLLCKYCAKELSINNWVFPQVPGSFTYSFTMLWIVFVIACSTILCVKKINKWNLADNIRGKE